MTESRKRILLIEEEPILRDIAEFRLELLGHLVTSVDSADAALERLAEETPDLAAVGNVADMDPIDLVNRLSEDPRTRELPILYLSAVSDLDEVQRAFNAGADEYLLIPYDPMMLETKVGELLTAAVRS